MLDALRNASRNKRWRPFWVPPQRAEPYMYGGNVECWLGPDGAPSLLDFWRVSPDAEFFLLRGHQEDGMQNDGVEPGSSLDLTLPTLRVGEVLLHAESMAQEFEAGGARVAFFAQWTGLRDRQLVSIANPKRMLVEHNTSHQGTYDTNLEVRANQIQEALPELVDRMVRPLYELFDFFPLPATLVAEELARMRGGH